MTRRVLLACLLAALCACSSDDDTAGTGDSGAGGSGGAGDGAKHSGTGGAAVTSGSGGSRVNDGSGGATTTRPDHLMTDAGMPRDAQAQGAMLNCGADAAPNPIDDPSSFAGMHADAVFYDCTQVVTCNRERDVDSQSNFLATCACATASALEDAQLQVRFLAKYTRCQSFISCDYTTCVVMSPDP